VRPPPEFAELWARHEVLDAPHGLKTITDPAVGELSFEYTSLPLADRTGRRLLLFNRRPGYPHLPTDEQAPRHSPAQ
jgi:hypothetical protein